MNIRFFAPKLSPILQLATRRLGKSQSQGIGQINLCPSVTLIPPHDLNVPVVAIIFYLADQLDIYQISTCCALPMGRETPRRYAQQCLTFLPGSYWFKESLAVMLWNALMDLYQGAFLLSRTKCCTYNKP